MHGLKFNSDLKIMRLPSFSVNAQGEYEMRLAQVV